MKQNMGSIDKSVRVILAIVLGVLYFKHIVNPTLALVLLIVGIVFLLTSLIGFCPLYLPFGIKTCKAKQ
jgi:hypothetical protein